MAGELLTAWGVLKTLEAAGASVASGAMSAAATNLYGVEADGLGFPDAQFILSATFAVAPTENSTIALCAQLTDLDGAETDVPEPTRPGRLLGTFATNNAATTQTLELVVADLPRNAKYYIYNANTGQAITSWTLKAVPKTYKTAT